MARLKRFAANLLSSYAAIGVNILYTIASVPLALHYLDKEEFGLWALVTQLSGYLMLLEFGMSGSVARSLTDHKDRIESGVYGSILKTGGRVFAIQGFLVFLLGLALARFAPSLLDLPQRLHAPFTVLMTVQAALNGGKLALGSLASPLWCHQRLDLSNLAGSISLVATFAVLWLGFHFGWHLYSLPAATAVGVVVGLAITYFSCRWLGYYPPQPHRGRFDSKLFRELFHFGGGLFLMNLGAQLASASQVIVVSRLLGIEAATTWSVSTKIFAMAQQFVSKIMDSSVGRLAEMVVRGEFSQLHRRFRDLVGISSLMAVAVSACITLMNGPFVEIWTSGRVYWEPWDNFLLGCLLLSTSITRCHTMLSGVTKLIKGMKFVYLVEGVVFVAASIIFVGRFGYSGMLISALACNLAITGSYAIRQTAKYLKVPAPLIFAWSIRAVCMMVIVGLSFMGIKHLAPLEMSAEFELSVGAGVFALIICPLMWMFLLETGLKRTLGDLVIKFVRVRKSRGA